MNRFVLMIKNKAGTTVAFVLAMISFALYVASYMISSSVETNKWITLIRLMIITGSVVCYLVCFLCCPPGGDYRRQISWINLFATIYHVLLFVVTFRMAFYTRYLSQMYMEVIWIIAGIIVLFAGRDELKRSMLKLKGEDNRFYALLSVIFAVILVALSYDVDGPHFVWDSNTMYNEVNALEMTDIFNIRKFFVFTHVDVGYFYPIFIFAVLINSIRTGFWLYNAICLTIASVGTVLLVRKTLGSNGRLFVVIASAACLFSPYICGISTYYSYDFGIVCFAPLLFALAFEEDWIYLVITGIYICLLKETGIVFVGAACIGVLVKELLCDKLSFQQVFVRKRTAVAVIPAVFLVLYKTYAGWTDPNGEMPFQFNQEHIVTQLKMYFLFNYEWLILLSIVLLFAYCVVKKREVSRFIPVYVVTVFVFLIPNLIFVTYENPRYMDAHPLCMLLILITLLSSLPGTIIRMGGIIVVLGLMFATSFWSFDPVTEMAFFAADTGKGTIYASDSFTEFGGDMSVYNRQYYGQDIVLDCALRMGIENGDEIFAVSTGRSHTTWGIDGGHYSYQDYDEKRDFTEFWNNKTNSREPAYDYDFFSDPDHTQLDIRYIYPDDDIIEALSDKSSFIYIYMPSQNDGRDDMVRNEFEVTEEGSFESHGWIMSYIRGKGETLRD